MNLYALRRGLSQSIMGIRWVCHGLLKDGFPTTASHCRYPLVICYIAIEAMDQKVSFPMKNRGLFHSHILLKHLPEGKSSYNSHETTIFLWFSYGFPMIFL